MATLDLKCKCGGSIHLESNSWTEVNNAQDKFHRQHGQCLIPSPNWGPLGPRIGDPAPYTPPPTWPVKWKPDTTITCSCRPENGGSGICSCILGGPTIT